MSNIDLCARCGYEYGLHHYQTNQCPTNADANAWRKTQFEFADDGVEQRATIAQLEARITELETRLKLA